MASLFTRAFEVLDQKSPLAHSVVVSLLTSGVLNSSLASFKDNGYYESFSSVYHLIGDRICFAFL